MLIVLVRHSSSFHHPWLKLCFLTGLFFFYRAPPYLSACTQPPPLTGPRQPPRLNVLPSLLPSSASLPLSLPASSFLFFWREAALQNNVHCQGCWRGATVCSAQHVQFQPAAPVCRLQTLKLEVNLWLFGDNRLRSSLRASRRSLQGLFRSMLLNVLWLHPPLAFLPTKYKVLNRELFHHKTSNAHMALKQHCVP